MATQTSSAKCALCFISGWPHPGAGGEHSAIRTGAYPEVYDHSGNRKSAAAKLVAILDDHRGFWSSVLFLPIRTPAAAS